MTQALCFACGLIKSGALVLCDLCDATPTRSPELDVAFTDHYLSGESLRELGEVVAKIGAAAGDDSDAGFRAVLRYLSTHPQAPAGAMLSKEEGARADALLAPLDLPAVPMKRPDGTSITSADADAIIESARRGSSEAIAREVLASDGWAAPVREMMERFPGEEADSSFDPDLDYLRGRERQIAQELIRGAVGRQWIGRVFYLSLLGLLLGVILGLANGWDIAAVGISIIGLGLAALIYFMPRRLFVRLDSDLRTRAIDSARLAIGTVLSCDPALQSPGEYAAKSPADVTLLSLMVLPVAAAQESVETLSQWADYVEELHDEPRADLSIAHREALRFHMGLGIAGFLPTIYLPAGEWGTTGMVAQVPATYGMFPSPENAQPTWGLRLPVLIMSGDDQVRVFPVPVWHWNGDLAERHPRVKPGEWWDSVEALGLPVPDYVYSWPVVRPSDWMHHWPEN